MLYLVGCLLLRLAGVCFCRLFAFGWFGFYVFGVFIWLLSSICFVVLLVLVGCVFILIDFDLLLARFAC